MQQHEHRIEKRPLVSDVVGSNNLIGKDREELKRILREIDEPEFRVKQLWHWIYWQGTPDIAQMTNLPKSLRQKLQDKFIVARPAQEKALKSEDGTRKWLLNLSDNNRVETVFIPDENKKRGSVCVSSQVGCTLSCKFCHTGTQNLVRNLTAGEIISQFMVVRDALGEWPTPNDGKRMVSNIVMMGMGEPLYNYDNVVKALKILMDGTGISLSKRKITLSTSGVVPKMRELGEVAPVNLAISLHAVRDDLRNEIVPINRKYPLAELLQACRDYPTLSNARRITFEYVMLAGVNDSNADAKELVKLIKGIPAKINLIPFNPWPGSIYQCSSWDRINEFADIVYRAGYSSPIRMPRGRDILAACGQLKSDSERKKGQKVIF